MIGRREFITLLGGAAAAWPLAARAQQPIGRTGKMPRVGMLMPGPAAHSAATLDPFYRGLHELGYIEGQNLTIERRDGDWKTGSAPRAGGRTGWAEGRHHCRVEYADGPRSEASYEFNPHHRSGHGRSHRRRAGRQPGTAGR
jgi:hypothetical protein